MFPNPATGPVSFVLQVQPGDVTIELWNAAAKLAAEFKIPAGQTLLVWDWQAEGAAPGVLLWRARLASGWTPFRRLALVR